MKKIVIVMSCFASCLSWASETKKFQCYSTPYIMDLEVSDSGEARLALNWPNNFGYVYSVRSEALPSLQEKIGTNETVLYKGFFTKSYPNGEGAPAFDLIAKWDDHFTKILGWRAVTYFKYIYFGPVENLACEER